MVFFVPFNAAVIFDTKSGDSEKLNYLSACLKSDAAELICSVSISKAIYTTAIGLLTDTYANKRRSNFSGLKKLLEVTNEHLRSLKELG